MFYNPILTAFRTACNFYKSPTPDQKIDYKNVTFSWDTTCFGSTPELVDIYILAPGDDRGQIYLYQNVEFAPGTFQTEFKPRWWGAKKTANLQVSIVSAGDLLFLSPIPAGPVFNVEYDGLAPPPLSSGASSVSMNIPDEANTEFNKWDYRINFATSHGLSKGRIAAAVILPLLLAIGAIVGYIVYTRRREAAKRQRWSENIDKRMSTISADWHSLSAAGAAAARNSLITNRTQSVVLIGRTSAYMDSGSRASPTRNPSVYERFTSKASFASEDVTQLGPNGRALSVAAAEGRPLSTLIYEKEREPLPPLPRTRSNSEAATTAEEARTVARPRPQRKMSSTSGGQARPISSNNPYAAAMRKSMVSSNDGHTTAVAAHSNSALPRTRLDSTGRPVDFASKPRITSRVSFVDAPVDREREWRSMAGAMPQDAASRSGHRSIASHYTDDFAVDIDDSLPALARKLPCFLWNPRSPLTFLQSCVQIQETQQVHSTSIH